MAPLLGEGFGGGDGADDVGEALAESVEEAHAGDEDGEVLRLRREEEAQRRRHSADEDDAALAEGEEEAVHAEPHHARRE